VGSHCTVTNQHFLGNFSFLSGPEVATAYFIAITDLAVASQLLVDSQLNCCNMLVFGLPLQSMLDL